jgi:hypothetical protein
MKPLEHFPAIYGTRRFSTAFKRAFHWSLTWSRTIHSTPIHPFYARSILILLTHLRLGLPSRLYPSDFPVITYKSSFFPHSCYMLCSTHPLWHHHSKYTWKNGSSYETPHYAAFSILPSLHSPLVRISSSAPCSQTPSACAPLLVSETNIHIHTEPQTKS